MKSISTILITVFCLGSLAQLGDRTKWTGGITFSPQTSYQKNNIAQSEYMGYDIERLVLNTSFGAQIQRGLTNRLKLITGFNYAVNDLKGTFYCHVCDFTGSILEERLKVRFAELPLSLRYTSNKNNWSFYGQLGVVGGLRVKLSEKLERNFPYKHLYEPKRNMVSKLNIDARVGLGLGYQISNLVRLEMTGFYKQSLVTNPNYRFNSIGVELGVLFKIK